jgi:hypothetical protein
MDKIVQSIVHILITQALAPFDANEKLLDETGLFLCQKIKRMPLSVRIPVYISTFIFDWAGIFYAGRRFSVQDRKQQEKMLQAAGQSAWYPLKQFLRFYQKLSVYIYYSLATETR